MTVSRSGQIDAVKIADLDLGWLTERYARARFVYLPRLISPDQAAVLLTATQSAPAKRVRCGLEHVSWDQQQFGPGDLAYEFFETDEARELVRRLAGMESIR